MSSFRKQMKNLIQSLSGHEIERFGTTSLAIINKKRRADAWFSNWAQIRSLIEKFEINLVIDVGANIGQFAQELRSFYPGDIFSFEPVTPAFQKLAKTASSDPNWHVYQLALGSQESTQKINISKETVFSSMLKTNEYCAEHFGGEALGAKEETVSIRRLDTLMDEIVPGIANRRVFLKMDTQGYDLEVFKGLGDKLALVCALQSEVALIHIYEGMPHWTESISLYERAGFGIIGMFPMNRDSGKIIEYDCLMAR